jgi:hypothetical protein
VNTSYKVIHWADEASGINDVDAAASEAGFLTLTRAAREILNAADYIIAIENGVRRPLTKGEEEELASLRKLPMSPDAA